MSILKIGLSGGIASGKSKVSEIFTKLGVPIIDADQIARNLFAPGAPLLKLLRQRFGAGIFNAAGELDRKALGRIVFKSPADLQWLNQLTHPKVSEAIQAELNQINALYVILDIPLLVDSSGNIPDRLRSLIDRVLIVDVTEQTQLSRLCQRDNISVEDAQAIIANQANRNSRLALADDIIDNNGKVEQLESQVTLLHNQYLTMSRARSAGD